MGAVACIHPGEPLWLDITPATAAGAVEVALMDGDRVVLALDVDAARLLAVTMVACPGSIGGALTRASTSIGRVRKDATRAGEA